MSDLYRIPGDDRRGFRLKKFVEYQHEVPSIHYRFLGEYIKYEGLDNDSALNLAWYMSVSYNELTAILLRELLEDDAPEEVWRKHRNVLEFTSARKYVKANDEFPALINDWRTVTNNMPFKWLICQIKPSKEETYTNIQTKIQQIKNCGRFASDIFLEFLVYYKKELGIEIEEPKRIDWKNCANLTSGIYNIFYEDEKANEYDRKHEVTADEKRYLTKKLELIQKEIEKTYPNQDSEISMFIGKICSFRNLFKGARYAGYHHDRQLEVLKKYERAFPEYNDLWGKCFGLREAMFPEKYLGEKGGWGGIRKERKKMWLKYGKTGAEN